MKSSVKKKLILLAAILAACAAMAGTGTLAYFTVEGTARNVITTGGIDIDLIEQMETETGELVEFPDKGVDGVMPGTTVSKIVSVKNIGPNSAWVRIQVDATITNKAGESLSLDVGTGKAMDITVLDGWTQGEDGYFYYNEKLAPGKTTSVLFEEVRFNTALDNSYQNCEAVMDVIAQAVQVDNNGETVLEAAGWPTKNK